MWKGLSHDGRYALGRLASFISGDVVREEFYIFTGSGSNGKSKTIELFEASFGAYCCKLPTSLLTQRRATRGRRWGAGAHALRRLPSPGARREHACCWRQTVRRRQGPCRGLTDPIGGVDR
jgi:hypothetical protein